MTWFCSYLVRSTSWLHSALLIQQTCLLRNKGSPVILQHPCTVSTSTQSMATHGPMLFLTCDNTWGRTHALCPLALRHLPQWLRDSRRQQSSPTQALSLSCGDFCSGALRSLWNSHSFGIVCILADLTLSRRSSLLGNLLVYLVVW